MVDIESLIAERARRWSVTCQREWKVDIDVSQRLAADGIRLVTAIDALVENAI
jgi:hypothetical protein